MGVATTVQAQRMDTPARAAILMDNETGAILFEKDADTPYPPASMSKLMTIYLALDLIKNEGFSLEDKVVISENVWRTFYRNEEVSKMSLEPGQVVTVLDLLKGVIVASGNDATIALGEHFAGSEENYVEWMNIKAEEIGLKNSHFINTYGLDADGHEMSVRDLAILSHKLINEFPKMYSLFAEREFEFGRDTSTNTIFKHRNRNPLLGTVPGADGLKTGYTSGAGYGLASSVVRDGRRLILVATGLSSKQARFRESQRLLEYGFRNFKSYKLFTAGQVVEDANVWLGNTGKVSLAPENDVVLTLSRRDRSRMKVKLNYNAPIPAPIVVGQNLATVTIIIEGKEPIVIPLVAQSNVEKLGGFGRLTAAFSYMLFGSN
jgi:D-alanyl-D-alanine carboxypeptidase (penicillin-binding protein 5/6)